jgi:hypothetical protein
MNQNKTITALYENTDNSVQQYFSISRLKNVKIFFYDKLQSYLTMNRPSLNFQCKFVILKHIILTVFC